MKNFSRGTERNASSTRRSVIPRSITCCWIICSRRTDSLTSFMLLRLYPPRRAMRYIDPSRHISLFSMLMPDRRPERHAVRPIITLTSDFGLSDHYVAAMKAVLVRQCPQARLLDVTH